MHSSTKFSNWKCLYVLKRHSLLEYPWSGRFLHTWSRWQWEKEGCKKEEWALFLLGNRERWSILFPGSHQPSNSLVMATRIIARCSACKGEVWVKIIFMEKEVQCCLQAGQLHLLSNTAESGKPEFLLEWCAHLTDKTCQTFLCGVRAPVLWLTEDR